MYLCPFWYCETWDEDDLCPRQTCPLSWKRQDVSSRMLALLSYAVARCATLVGALDRLCEQYFETR
jgi:hypothetical protein